MLDYEKLFDYRWYTENTPSKAELNLWKGELRHRLFRRSGGRSVLTGKSLSYNTFEMHEGIFPRSIVPRSISWQWRIFAGPNCFVLNPGEHRPSPPSRAVCYWLSVVQYGKSEVDEWIDELPFKVDPDIPYIDPKEVIPYVDKNYGITDDWLNTLERELFND